MIPNIGSSLDNSDLALLLDEQLNAMGDAITQEVGTLAWCEAYALAITMAQALDFIRLISNQLTTSSLNIYAARVAKIYNIAVQGLGEIPDNLQQIRDTVGLYQAQTGAPPTYSNFFNYLSDTLGFQKINEVTDPNYSLGSGIFIGLEDVHELQDQATGNDGYPAGVGQWFSPLSAILVRIWQPRDKNDNLLMTNDQFYNLLNSYKKFAQQWIPANLELRNMELIYPGNDGYGDTISISQGSNTVVGINTKFTTDLAAVNLNGWLLPIEVVADNNQLYNYLVTHVIDDTHLTIRGTAFSDITNRTFRLLGVQMDTPYAYDTMLFNS